MLGVVGLDWNPMGRPFPGHEAEFERLFLVLDDEDVADRDALVARLVEMMEPPYLTLGAPQVGRDPEADEWLRERLREADRLGDFDQVRAEMTGYCVLALLPSSDGLPVYTSWGYDGVDRYTFRGAFLADTASIIGDELLQEAFGRKTATELAAYGEALLARGRAYAEAHGVTAIAEQYDAPDADEDDPRSLAHIIYAAARWCAFWSARGHGLEPYY
jgi:hypothetical protein